jgi:hypothetical protein
MPFHYDPTHDDEFLDTALAGLDVMPAREGLSLELAGG